MNKFLIIGASIAGILGTMDILTTDPLKYGACALLGITALMTFNELNPPKQQGQFQRPMERQVRPTVREKPKVIWDEFETKAVKEEVKTKEEPKFIIEDTNEKPSQLQGTEKMQKVG